MMYFKSIYKYIKIKIFIRANLFLEYKDLVKKTITKYQALFTVLVINLFRNTYRHMASSWQNWSALRWWHYLFLYWPWTIWLFPNFLSLAPLGFYKASLVTLNVQDSELESLKPHSLGTQRSCGDGKGVSLSKFIGEKAKLRISKQYFSDQLLLILYFNGFQTVFYRALYSFELRLLCSSVFKMLRVKIYTTELEYIHSVA